MIARSAGSASLCSTIRGDLAGARVAHDPPVAGRVRDLGGEDGDRVAVGDVRGEQLAERVAVEQRDVAGEHDDGAVDLSPSTAPRRVPPRPTSACAAASSTRERAPDGATGARDVVLVGDEHRGVELADVGGDRVPLVPDDDDDAVRLERRARRRARGRAASARRGCAAPWGWPNASGCPRLRRGRRRRRGGCRSRGLPSDRLERCHSAVTATVAGPRCRRRSGHSTGPPGRVRGPSGRSGGSAPRIRTWTARLQRPACCRYTRADRPDGPRAPVCQAGHGMMSG